MAKAKRGTKRRRRDRRGQRPARIEDGRADVVTVAWMLTVLATLLADVGWLLAHLFLSNFDPAADLPSHIRSLPSLMLLIAACSGTVCLALIYPTHLFRIDPPPRTITAFAVLIAAIPLVTIAVMLWKQ